VNYNSRLNSMKKKKREGKRKVTWSEGGPTEEDDMV
jgi:hypothetical protein